MAPILRRVSKKFSPPHPLEARMDDLLVAVTGLSEQVDLLRGDLAARPDPLVAARGLSGQVELLREDLAARPDPFVAIRDLSRQVERLRDVLATRPDPSAQEMTIRVVHARRRRREEPADNIE